MIPRIVNVITALGDPALADRAAPRPSSRSGVPVVALALPWKKASDPPPDADGLVASVTRLRVTRWRDVPRLVWAALRLRHTFPRVEGAVVAGLAAQPWRRTFWTLTLWNDDAALAAYVRSAEHAEVMRAFRNVLADTASARWQTHGRPTWAAARRQLEGATLR